MPFGFDIYFWRDSSLNGGWGCVTMQLLQLLIVLNYESSSYTICSVLKDYILNMCRPTFKINLSQQKEHLKWTFIPQTLMLCTDVTCQTQSNLTIITE